MDSILSDHQTEIEVLCQNYHIKALYAAGKVCSGTFGAEDEITLLVDFNGLSLEQRINYGYLVEYKFENVFQHKVEMKTLENSNHSEKVLLFQK